MAAVARIAKANGPSLSVVGRNAAFLTSQFPQREPRPVREGYQAKVSHRVCSTINQARLQYPLVAAVARVAIDVHFYHAFNEYDALNLSFSQHEALLTEQVFRITNMS